MLFHKSSMTILLQWWSKRTNMAHTGFYSLITDLLLALTGKSHSDVAPFRLCFFLIGLLRFQYVTSQVPRVGYAGGETETEIEMLSH
jgi:hypothetical protein